MDSKGNIARFESEVAAAEAGFVTMLTKPEASAALHLPREQRHGYVANTRHIEASRAAAKAARKARRKNRK